MAAVEFLSEEELLFVLPTIQCVIDIVWCLGSRIDSIVLTRADYDFICQARSAILGGD
ncbi:hypothetical protein [Mycobacterium leprae]|uniref:hypothetical protein n=1 Tax=Mycobacterium leprae TaxID=1769 RepID=UPI000B11786D|nr:hypothetical protein [Mycobacterium leprae]